jgi:hypothetical protein
VGKTCADATIVLDGNAYRECTFRDYKLVFAGGELPELVSCAFHDCKFGFEGPAANTVAFLRGIASAPGASQLIREMFPAVLGH